MVYTCDLSPELQKKAREELNEDPERRQQDIEHIREWLKKQPHIHARTDDMTILRFLRGCKFSLEKTKKKMDMFYTCRTMVPEWFSNRDPQDPKMKAILELGLVLTLPPRSYSKRGCLVIIARPGKQDFRFTTMDDVLRSILLLNDIVAGEEERGSILGSEAILDFTGFSFSHAAQVTLPIAKKAATIMQEGYPMRPKGLHYINTSPSFDTAFSIFKAFMKEKMKKRVHIHGSNLESLHEYFSKDVLPKEYGGTNGSVEELTSLKRLECEEDHHRIDLLQRNTDFWIEKVNSRRDWLLEDEKYKVDESKRPGKPKTTSDIFGLEGSFRKLNVD